ncbi:MAG: hypothetical protein CL946_05520, partial [Ectothiorhodospiraceae bacterium]|nr:hypothetical protein [Ectothiorhodospiraceae bacterium]
MTLLRYCSLPIVAVLMTFASTAQNRFFDEPEYSFFGLHGGLNSNIHRLSFSELPGAGSCCPGYETQAGLGYTAGLHLELPLGEQWRIMFRGTLMSHGINLTADETKTASDEGFPVRALIRHSLDATLNSLGASAALRVNVVDLMHVYAGMRFGYVVVNDYEQRETLLQPETGTFENNRRVRNEQSGEIPSASTTHVAAIFGLGYDVPLNFERTLMFTPEIGYAVNLTQISNGLDWYADAFRGAVTLKWALGAKDRSSTYFPEEDAEYEYEYLSEPVPDRDALTAETAETALTALTA